MPRAHWQDREWSPRNNVPLQVKEERPVQHPQWFDAFWPGPRAMWKLPLINFSWAWELNNWSGICTYPVVRPTTLLWTVVSGVSSSPSSNLIRGNQFQWRFHCTLAFQRSVSWLQQRGRGRQDWVSDFLDTLREKNSRLLTIWATLGLQKRFYLHPRFIHSSFNAHIISTAPVRKRWLREAKQPVPDHKAGNPQPSTQSCTLLLHLLRPLTWAQHLATQKETRTKSFWPDCLNRYTLCPGWRESRNTQRNNTSQQRSRSWHQWQWTSMSAHPQSSLPLPAKRHLKCALFDLWH